MSAPASSPPSEMAAKLARFKVRYNPVDGGGHQRLTKRQWENSNVTINKPASAMQTLCIAYRSQSALM
jgi:hypothetical protein